MRRSLQLVSGKQPTRADQTPPNNLPAQLTSFIGREQERLAVGRLLLRDDVRLLTLTGPPGIGKTRLSLRVAQDVLGRFPDGVYFVALAPVHGAALVLPAIAQALDVRETDSDALLGALKEHLRDKQMLLVLDNFEQVVEAGSLITELLAACPELKVMVTSRHVLHVSGEHEFAVPSLQLPDIHALPDLDVLSNSEAVALFTQRARAVKPDFQLTPNNAVAIARICVQLDGSPLAIELAAPRVKLLPPQAMLLRLEKRLSLLTGGARDLPARQRTLHSAIAWSYNLLTADEQALFRRLGVFVGGYTLEAAEAVCNPDKELQMDTLEGLALLLDKSLLKSEGSNQEQSDGEPRFFMLETLREYALERLIESGEESSIRRRHAEHFLHLAEEAQHYWRTPQQVEWVRRLEVDLDNLRAALRWARRTILERTTGVEVGLRLAIALWQLWYLRGYLNEARDWITTMLSLPGAQEQKPLRARALASAGRIAYAQSDYRVARTFFEESRAACMEVGDKWGLAYSLEGLAEVATEEGDYVTAPPMFEESLTIMRELGDTRDTAGILMNLGYVGLRTGDYAQAVAPLEEALALSRQHGDMRMAGFALTGLGEAALRLGDHALARALFEESLKVRRDLGDKWGIAISLASLGWASMSAGSYDRAAELLAESILMRKEMGDIGGLAWCLEKLASMSSQRGQPERAARLLGTASALRLSVGSVVDPADQPEYERDLNDIRARLGEGPFASAWAQGQATPLDEAVRYALEVTLPEGLPPHTQNTQTAPQPEYEGLTNREREIAALIAQSKSNSEIAEELVISKRTVETHITNILSKLGFTSRGQIATWAIKRGLIGSPE